MEFKPRICSSGILMILCIFFLINTCGPTVVLGEGEQQQQPHKMEDERINEQPKKPSLWEMTKNAFSLYTSSPLRVPTYLDNSKNLFNQVRAYFFPPNLEGGMGNIEVEPGSSGDDGGAAEKVKEVVGKSFRKSKETVEDSAKSAANIVGETVQTAKEKVKRSFSDSDKNRESGEPQSEL